MTGIYCDCDCHNGDKTILCFDACCSGPCSGCDKPIHEGLMHYHAVRCREWYKWATKIKRKDRSDSVKLLMKEHRNKGEK